MERAEKPIRDAAFSYTPAQALMAVAVMAAESDGKIAQRELGRLRSMFHEHGLFAPVEHADTFISDRMSDIRRHGRDFTLDACGRALSPRMRETAYAWAVSVVQSDGGHHQTEHAFLNVLSRRFRIAGPLAAKIRAVVAIFRRVA